MSKINVQPVVMAGGSGTRLWPLSRAQHPKQFLVLHGNQSLFQQAAKRLCGLASDDIDVGTPCIVGNEEHRFLILDQLRELKMAGSTVLLEPIGRNTAPAMTLAALNALEGGDDPVLVVSPADQTATNEAAFTAALRRAVRAAARGAIVILGVAPERPETGFGYIRCRSATEVDGEQWVAQFVEKPDLATAQAYMDEGGYYWNSGIFVVRASVWLAALDRFRPDIGSAASAAWAARTADNGFIRPGKEEFAAIPSESVDYAVMEKCPSAESYGESNRKSGAKGSGESSTERGGRSAAFELRMVPLDAGWSDLGAWDAVWQVSEKDVDGNSSVGDSLVHGSRNTLVHATSRLVGVVGLDNVVVIETPDAVLVIDRSRSQEVKQIVGRLQAAERSEHTLHRQVQRPWGSYDSIDSGARFQVKRIVVKPGASLSLQKHHHRAEHWIVVTGTAEVTNGDKVILLTENQSTYIPVGTVHRLTNPGKVPLELIEVQSGSYLGEDDIVRFEDTYGRVL